MSESALLVVDRGAPFIHAPRRAPPTVPARHSEMFGVALSQTAVYAIACRGLARVGLSGVLAATDSSDQR